jgi:hypothetical protein
MGSSSTGDWLVDVGVNRQDRTRLKSCPQLRCHFGVCPLFVPGILGTEDLLWTGSWQSARAT